MVATKKDTNTKTKKRPPIVTIMGHVDHGKTSILDKIRESNITAKEVGEITQHIGAYQVSVSSDAGPRKITFIDTPGHAAFAQMRARGGHAADMVVLVVAADDGVKDQTLEAISHAKAAEVPILVAINKMDLGTALPDKVKKQLIKAEVLVEELGGDVVAVSLSAKTGEGIEEFLEMILLCSDMLELESFPDKDLEAVVIEAHMDSNRGATATAIVKQGTLKKGDKMFTQSTEGKVRALRNDWGKPLEAAYPGDPVEILGLKEVPAVGELISTKKVQPEKIEPKILKKTEKDEKEESSEVEEYALPVVIKADTKGTLEAVVASVGSLGDEESSVHILHSGVGDISESDVLLASSGQATIVGFNVSVPSASKDLAKALGISIRQYTLIYKLIEDIGKLLSRLESQDVYQGKGLAVVMQSFELPSGDKIAGLQVTHGVLREKDKVKLIREGEEVYRGSIKQIKIGKEKVSKVPQGKECGVLFKGGVDFNEGDVVEIL